MNKFKVGDRVAVYDNGLRWTGSVSDIMPSGKLVVARAAGMLPFAAFPQQCRKLVNGPRRRVWINEYPGMRLSSANYDNRESAEGLKQSDCLGTVEFVEVRPKKK